MPTERVRWRIGAAMKSRPLLGLPMAVVLLMGLGKAADLPMFVDALGTWKLIPRSVIPWIALLLPPIEIVIAGCWFLGMCRTRMEFAAILVVSVLTGLYLWQLVEHGPPVCGCAGKIGGRTMEHPAAVLGRNAFVVGSLALGHLRSSR
jgi:hypothetical protein